MDEGDFKNHPKSIAELRSDRTNNSADWSPRDVLIHMLRMIDEGDIAPNVLVVSYSTIREDEPDFAVSDWWASAPNPLLAVGTLARVAHRMQRAMDDDQ